MIKKETEFFECVCSSDEHTLKATLFTDTENNLTDFYFGIYLCQHKSFFQRLVAAVKYVFGYKSKYGDFDSFILNPKDYDRLSEMIQRAQRPDNSL